MGRWQLDRTSLRFKYSGTKSDLVVPLSTIRRIEESRRKFLVVRKPVLVITHRPRRASGPRRLWLLVGDLVGWQDALAEWVGALAPAAAPPVTRAAAITQALEQADPAVGRILDVLCAGPATSAALAAALELDQDGSLELPAVLNNELAAVEAALGTAVVRYERHRFDPRTSRVYSMHWWLDGQVKWIWLTLRSPLEIHVGPTEMVLITNVPTRVDCESLAVEIDDDGLGILLTASDYARFVGLPEPVAEVLDVQMREHGTLAVRARLLAAAVGALESAGSANGTGQR
ncbi:MAG: hypothetical protein ACOYEV_12850 [Candidatus Nanopelagicales bacterium]